MKKRHGSSGAADFTGAWKTDFGRVELKRDGSIGRGDL